MGKLRRVVRRIGLDEFDAIVADRAVAVVFQPIVDLGTGEVVGIESLARPPAGSTYAGPHELFAEAYRRGRVGELDWVCRGATFRALLEHPVPDGVQIFMNVEPAAMDAPCPADIVGSYAAATTRYPFIIEITERAMTDDPGELLAAVERIRDVRAGVAIDDVGADPASLALMPLVTPDVIKLDLRLIRARPTPEVAAIVNAVMAESERTGATILAEGIETLAHERAALAMGASLGQGWRYGHPRPLPFDLTTPRNPLRSTARAATTDATPFALASATRRALPSTTELLAAMSRHIEHQVMHSSGRPLVISAFESIDNFGEATRRRYEMLSADAVLVAALGRDMPEKPADGVRGAALSVDDPLRHEWAVVVLDSHFAAALTARPRPGGPNDGGRMWDFVVTHDRELVLSMARPLLARLPGIVH